MDYWNFSVAATLIATLIFGVVAQSVCIRFAHRYRLLDIPSARRRHNKSTPVIGGVGVVLTMFFGLALTAFQSPGIINEYGQSLLTLSVCVCVLVGMGLMDDLRGLSPAWKLSVEFLLAAFVVTFEPQVHSICLIWSEHLGIFMWPLAMVWIVGITNAINLIDGLDGLAGGMSLLVASSICILSIWTGSSAITATLAMGLMIPSLLGFLRYNWHPAKIFLGDNGSLTVGFLLATSSLICRPYNKSWVMIASLVLMLGYPILDMGLAVLRRWRKGQPLFKADRNHLHFRILRLGPGVGQTAALLLSIGLYLQITALAVNLTSQATAALGLSIVSFSIFSVLYLVRSIELWRVQRLSVQLMGPGRKNLVGPAGAMRMNRRLAIRVELEPLFESALFEEKSRFQSLVSALELMMSTMVRREDLIYTTEKQISIVFDGGLESDAFRTEMVEKVKERVNAFLDLFSLQCSMASLPISVEEVSVAKSATVALVDDPSKGRAA